MLLLGGRVVRARVADDALAWRGQDEGEAAARAAPRPRPHAVGAEPICVLVREHPVQLGVGQERIERLLSMPNILASNYLRRKHTAEIV